MSEPNSHICPECFAPRASDGTPSCGCARRVSDAHLETRTAEAAAAEDFDPLRIRPYVELGDEPATDEKPEALTIQLRRVEPSPSRTAPDHAETLAMRVATPMTATKPDAADVRLFQEQGQRPRPTIPFPPASPPARPPRGRRRRPKALVVALAGTAAAGVMAAAGLASALFSYDAPKRSSALPDDVRASAPDTSPDGDSTPVEPTGEAGSEAHAPAPPISAPPPSPTKSPSPSPSQTSASPSPSTSASPTQSAPSAGASGRASASGVEEDAGKRAMAPKTLRLGDEDPEVTELQLRLRQLGIYNGDIDESFDTQVEQAVIAYQINRSIPEDKDERGVYGLTTRAQLESETKEP
ncbi:peptidoglycan-binding domain-containing protein [Streptomyces capitiformicae]|uniref:Peptidoglycan-binding protein n=1 Tax=Streptomyces capitiformicae TaxID=2014920 RepID=A0A918YYA9_9ACTN|nr:peptidoglycan-binding domain-containing protein [Streptomyces capitiformicae]GHE28826.1 peptidoglycan-binding protein [Streptomyces capitiformicae]